MMKFGQWGDRPAKQDGSFSFAPVNVVNSTAHTAPSALIKGKGTQLGGPRRGLNLGAGEVGNADGEELDN